MSSLDLIVIGAGAAGIGAGHAARRRGLSYQILEARARVGGRAYTDDRFGFPLDHGCHWLHAADINPLTRLADGLGMGYRREPGHLFLFARGGQVSDAENADWEDYCERCFAAGEAAGARGLDVSLASVIPQHRRWRPTFDNLCAAFNGLEPEEVSTLDCHRYQDTGLNYPLAQGYGALIAALARDLPISLDTPVQRVRWGGPRVRVETPRGTLEADRLLITVSTAVLAAGSIHFDPPLPAWKLEAIDNVPLGQANKVMFRLKDCLPGLPDTSYGRLDRGSVDTLGLQCHAFGYPMVTAYLSGRSGESLERAGPQVMEAFAREGLRECFGTAVESLLDGVQITGWGLDPYSLGAYSLARPGAARAREPLGEALDDRLFFAGEAVSLAAFGTAHGAWTSAINAVESMAVDERP